VNPHWEADFAKLPSASHHARRETIPQQRRMVFQHAIRGGDERGDAEF
jgi:hypothetical protein